MWKDRRTLRKTVARLISGCFCAGILLSGCGAAQDAAPADSDRKSTAEEETAANLLDQAGQEIARITIEEGSARYHCEYDLQTYVDLAWNEALDIVAELEEMDREKAAEYIVDREMEIATTFSREAHEAVCHSDIQTSGERGAASVADTKGNLLACLGVSHTGDSYNAMTVQSYAGSVIKPLSVYAPALELGLISWSSIFTDSPYAMIRNADGQLEEWPTNTKPYTELGITVEQALEESNNAVAVKVLKTVGGDYACRFLEESFGIRTQQEQTIIREEGEDRVLGNLALGYLEEGVTVAQITEAYQMFANGGWNYGLHTIRQMETKSGNYYTAKEQPRRIIREETAYIMNRLLKQVVDEGTGRYAQTDGVEVCGKTGTSEYGDHWFAGVTPEYVCVVWRKEKDDENGTGRAGQSFHQIVERLPQKEGVSYPVPDGVRECNYCKKTGGLAGENCEKTGIGYYAEDSIPILCDE